MGLFSKTKTYVESSTVAVFEPLPDSTHQSILGSALRDRSVSADLLANSLNGLGVKAKQYYRYGRDEYYYGLPEGTVEVKHAHGNTVKIVLDDIEGEPTTMAYSLYSIADASYFAHDYLQNTRGWDYTTNIVSNPGFTPVGVVTFYSAQWESPTSIKIFYLHDTELNLEEEVIVLTEPVDTTKGYYHVGYSVNSNPTVRKYWQYNSSLDTYESLQVVESEPESPYFPVVPIVRDNVDLTADSLKETELYITSKALLKKFKIDFEDIGAGVQENPDIDSVDHAYVHVSAPIQSESQNVQKYLFEYFHHLYLTQQYDKDDYDAWIARDPLGVSTPPMNKVIIKEVENTPEGTETPNLGFFNTELGYTYIETELVDYTPEEITEQEENPIKIGTVNRETIIEPKVLTDDYGYETSYMKWNKHISTTQYFQLRVVGLKHVNYIYGNKHIDTSLEDSLSATNDDFNLMVHNGVLSGFNIFKQSDILNDSIRISFNSVERVKLEWYQTSIFKAIIIIVGAVISVLSLGSDGGTTLAWAIAITGATNFVAQLAVAILINTLLSVLFTKLIDVIGFKNAALLTILSTIYTLASGDIPIMSGESLLTLQSGISSAAKYYIQSESVDLRNEYDQMKVEQEKEQAELDELIEAFPVNFLDPFTFLDLGGSLAHSSESPEVYYNTRIHSGNIGVLAFAEISRYVDTNLQLPGVTDRQALNIL